MTDLETIQIFMLNVFTCVAVAMVSCLFPQLIVSFIAFAIIRKGNPQQHF